MPSNIIAETPEYTVIDEYEPELTRSSAYQSEAELEKEFIDRLVSQGYEYLSIHSEADLIANLRTQLEKLNNYHFTDSEWEKFLRSTIANPNDHVLEKTGKIQVNNLHAMKCDDGSTINIKLIDKENIHSNFLQVINQYEVGKADGAKKDNRYDVTILVNGLPLVHVELKRRGVPIREAFNQINRYQRESFWAGHGLFEYIQIFVISNGTDTKYYSNTTRYNAEKEHRKAGKSESTTSNSFEFTSFWADRKNKPLPDLVDFTKTFFAKHTILNVLTKYCVFTTGKKLLVMRPYQITATECILERINSSTNYKTYGTIQGGGYIWHTTGSGKTLTSFKTARLASNLDYIDKVLVVVDRKDLDYQTFREYVKFEEGAVDSNTSTKVLEGQLNDSNNIIVTTIQKLNCFIKANKEHSVYDKHIVLIFDECHRSQFSDMHNAIVKKFKKYHIFGFTGTPIFAENKVNGTSNCHITEDLFGKKLHSYTIKDAIRDKNVLPFRVEYFKTMSQADDITDERVAETVDGEKAFRNPKRISKITKYILDHFDQKTYRKTKTYEYNKITNIDELVSSRDRKVTETTVTARTSGFNSLFAVADIPMAMLYYNEFKKQMANLPAGKRLRIATIFSAAPNDSGDGYIDLSDEENSDDPSGLDQTSKDFLENAIKDYNVMFGTNFDMSAKGFSSYYKDVSLRMKNKEIDLLIVVNMFLTGFDAPTLNTLWVDKFLRMHGLLQAFSRTNRILNSVKTFGNIVCFRNLEKEVDASIALFGDDNSEESKGLVLIRKFDDYYYGYVDENGEKHEGYVDMIKELTEEFPLTEPPVESEKAKKKFIKLFGSVLRAKNTLSPFNEFEGKEILTERDLQDYLARYQDLRDEYCAAGKDKMDISDDIVFEVELIRQVEINIDYILMKVEEYHKSHCEDKEILITIAKAIAANSELRSKKELIENFIASINEDCNVTEEWTSYIAKQKEKELREIIESERLKEDETRKLVAGAFRDGELKTSGTTINDIMPPLSRFGGNNTNRTNIKNRIIEKLTAFFDKYYGLG